jgi:hypothetical protein
MKVIDKLVTEWAYRCKKGYPDMNNPDDIKILKEIYSEYGIVFEEEEDSSTQTVDELTQQDIQVLTQAFEKVKEPYSKYLSIFNYFDPNSLGTVSEVLLTKLLNKVEGIEAEHVGGGQGLADIVVNGHHVSLKTTVKGSPIGLGSDQINSNFADTMQVVQELNKLYTKDPTLSNLTVNQLRERIPENIYSGIYSRLDAIAKKLSGEHNKEFFVWVEKIYTNKILTGIVIHTVKYDYSQVMNTFLTSKLVLTGKAWGVKNEKNKQTIRPDSTGKLLNITPEFVYASSKESRTSIDLSVSVKHSKEEVEKQVSDKFFTALDIIYSELF